MKPREYRRKFRTEIQKNVIKLSSQWPLVKLNRFIMQTLTNVRYRFCPPTDHNQIHFDQCRDVATVRKRGSNRERGDEKMAFDRRTRLEANHWTHWNWYLTDAHSNVDRTSIPDRWWSSSFLLSQHSNQAQTWKRRSHLNEVSMGR